MKHRIHDTIFLTLILGVAFMLPVWGRIVPPLIVFLVVNWLVDGRTWTNAGMMLKGRRRASVMWFGALYLLYCVGMLYTSDSANGFFDLEVKLSLLLFPLVFSLAAFPVDSLRFMRQVSTLFIAGCLTGAVSLLIRAGYRYHVEGATDAFYYTGLSWHFHASYLAMYHNLAIVMLLIRLPENEYRRTGWWYTGTSLALMLLTAMIFMLASKAGIASFGLIIVAAFVYTGVRLKNLKLMVGMATMSVVVLSAGFILSPGALNRMTAAGKTLSVKDSTNRSVSESSADRLVAWKTALEIIRQHPFTGVGTGDTRREITSAYQAHHDISAYEQKLNAHNQYLQTALALGIPGVLVLLAMLAVPGWLAFRLRHDLYLLFILLFAFNLLVESMFEVQAGILFYALFNTLFFIGMKNGDPFARTPA